LSGAVWFPAVRLVVESLFDSVVTTAVVLSAVVLGDKARISALTGLDLLMLASPGKKRKYRPPCRKTIARQPGAASC
jgi:hypothetical protein